MSEEYKTMLENFKEKYKKHLAAKNFIATNKPKRKSKLHKFQADAVQNLYELFEIEEKLLADKVFDLDEINKIKEEVENTFSNCECKCKQLNWFYRKRVLVWIVVALVVIALGGYGIVSLVVG